MRFSHVFFASVVTLLAGCGKPDLSGEITVTGPAFNEHKLGDQAAALTGIFTGHGLVSDGDALEEPHLLGLDIEIAPFEGSPSTCRVIGSNGTSYFGRTYGYFSYAFPAVTGDYAVPQGNSRSGLLRLRGTDEDTTQLSSEDISVYTTIASTEDGPGELCGCGYIFRLRWADVSIVDQFHGKRRGMDTFKVDDTWTAVQRVTCSPSTPDQTGSAGLAGSGGASGDAGKAGAAGNAGSSGMGPGLGGNAGASGSSDALAGAGGMDMGSGGTGDSPSDELGGASGAGDTAGSGGFPGCGPRPAF